MAKWPSKKLKYVDIDLYKQRIWLTDSREIWTKCCKAMGDTDLENMAMYGGANTSWANAKTGDIKRLIGVFDKSAVMHECSHASIDICHDTGIVIAGDQQEPFCYLIGYLFEEVSKKLGIGNGD